MLCFEGLINSVSIYSIYMQMHAFSLCKRYEEVSINCKCCLNLYKLVRSCFSEADIVMFRTTLTPVKVFLCCCVTICSLK